MRECTPDTHTGLFLVSTFNSLPTVGCARALRLDSLSLFWVRIISVLVPKVSGWKRCTFVVSFLPLTVPSSFDCLQLPWITLFSFDPQDGELEVTSDFDKAPVEVLARVHSNDYLQFVTDLAKQMTAIAGPGQKQMAPVPFTPQVKSCEVF